MHLKMNMLRVCADSYRHYCEEQFLGHVGNLSRNTKGAVGAQYGYVSSSSWGTVEVGNYCLVCVVELGRWTSKENSLMNRFK